MTTHSAEGRIPQWTVGDRLRKARQLTGKSTREFAEEIGISQKSVNNAEADTHAVRRIVINAWALATGVSREWLETGIAPAGGPDEGDQEAVRHQGLEPRTRWFGGSDAWGLSAA